MDAAFDYQGWLSSEGSLSGFLKSLEINQKWLWSHAHYESTVHEAIRYFQVQSVCELGGGRSPLLTRQFVKDKGLHYVVNDISPAELARGPGWVAKACFDISSTEIPASLYGQFDFIFSHMLMEHVAHGETAYRNIYNMLKIGGVCFHFHPVLYHPALVFNWLMPECFSKRLLLLLQPDRHDEGYPKFPAKYSFCVIGSKTTCMIRNIGFDEVALVPFYGTGYLGRIAPLQWLEEKFSNYAQRNGKSYFASKSYTFCRKESNPT